jgi:pyridoxal biosynthesis lyase PdxS
MDGVFVGSGIFKSGDPAKRARAIVQAVGKYLCKPFYLPREIVLPIKRNRSTYRVKPFYL